MVQFYTSVVASLLTLPIKVWLVILSSTEKNQVKTVSKITVIPSSIPPPQSIDSPLPKGLSAVGENSHLKKKLLLGEDLDNFGSK